MKFGDHFAAYRIPEWVDGYVDYKALRKILEAPPPPRRRSEAGALALSVTAQVLSRQVQQSC